MRVRISTPLRSYTDQAPVVTATGGTVGAVLLDLDRQFPGIRFRVIDEQNGVRKHMKIFVNTTPIRDPSHPVLESDEVTLMQALSGG